MKKMRKFVSVLLTMVMALAVAVPSFAAGYTPAKTTTVYFNTGGIATYAASTITASKFNGYKLLNLETSLKCDEDHTHTSSCWNYAYTLNEKYQDADSNVNYLVDAAKTAGIKLDGATVTEDTLIEALSKLTTDGDKETLQKFAKAVYTNIKDLDADATLDLNEKDSLDIAQGYWLFVDTTTYTGTDSVKSLFILDTHGKEELEVTPKQDVPTVDKDVNKNSASIGETVKFTLTGTMDENLYAYEKYTYKFHDTMSKGLTLDKNSFVVKLDGKTLTEGTDYTITYKADDATNACGKDGCKCSFVIAMTDLSARDDVTPDSKIVVTYNATVNEDAEIGNPGNPNDIYVEYTNDYYTGDTGKTKEDRVIVFTFELDVTKVDGKTDKALEGAEFILYREGTNGKEYLQVENKKVKDWVTDKADASTLKSDEDGKFEIKGLGEGTYYLEETKAPEGYNLLKNPIKLVIDAEYDRESGTDTDVIKLTGLTLAVNDGKAEDGTLSTGIVKTEVENNSGFELPSTGGIGTTIFYVAGGIMVVGAAVLLVTKKRMKTED